jgi:hypothetical protein
MARRRTGGAALGWLSEGGREEGGTWPGGPDRFTGPDGGSAGGGGEKKKIEIYFENDF